MGIKTFVYDVRGFGSVADRIDSDYAAWVASETPTSVDAVTSSMSSDTLVITVRFTA